MGKTKELIKKFSWNVVGSLTDFLIWYAALVGSSVGKTGPRGFYEAFKEADEVLAEVNHHSLAATWHQLFKKRLLTYKKREKLYSPQITEFGKKRLAEKIPTYQKIRPWDKKIYLITYDIPERARIKRDALRSFLHQISSRLITESTYINIYNPRGLVSDFISKKNIPGIIIISDIGQDGGIGESTVQDLLVKVYELEKINDRYENFISHTKNKTHQDINILFEYLSILKDDPQLPFELLPKGWLGDKAYEHYLNLQRIYINRYAAA